jgi:hypothetical protein
MHKEVWVEADRGSSKFTLALPIYCSGPYSGLGTR